MLRPRTFLRRYRDFSVKKTSPKNDAKTTSVAKSWTFLTNHAHVLIVLYNQSDLSLREVANRVGITERAVQRIVQDLEESGYLDHEKIGRKNYYSVTTNQALRHPIEAHRKIGDLLRLVSD